MPAVHESPVVPTCGSFAQLVPHAPQLLTSVPSTLTHVPLQSFWLAGHAHTPAWHVSPPLHTCPQLPQFALSVCLFVHAVPQKSGAAVVGHWQVPPLHCCDDGQAVAHDPQWVESVITLVHVPVQFVWSAPQLLAHPLTPASDGAHSGVIPLHITPHPPQFDGDESAVPHPVPASAQSEKPGEQA